MVVGVDGGEGAELEAIDVGEDGGATGGQVVVSEEYVKVAEGIVDGLGGLEALAAGQKGGLEIEDVGFIELLGMREAEGSAGSSDIELAAAAGGPAVKGFRHTAADRRERRDSVASM